MNMQREKDNAMAADTSLLFKALTGSPCHDTGRIFLNTVIEHSPEGKQSITIAPLQHQHSAIQREEKEKEEEYN